MIEDQELLRGWQLEGWAKSGGLDGLLLEKTILRAESVHARDLFAYRAAYGTLSFEELREAVINRTLSPYSLDREWLGRLGCVTGLQNFYSKDTDFAIVCLQWAIGSLGEKETTLQKFEKLLAELLFESKRFSELEHLLAGRPSLKNHYYSYLRVDAQNPFVRDDLQTGAQETWLTGFNRQFTRNDLIPVKLRDSRQAPFNRLYSDHVEGPAVHGPLVTVIMTTYKPNRDDVVQSARSVLDQTWRNIELLVVDDASPAEYSPVLEEVDALDDRVRVVRLDVNGGTYVARNKGIAEAQGEFVTGQDADDWSHPQRIQTQANYLIRNPERPGNQVYTVNMTEDLVRIRRGYGPFIPSAPTLMVRTQVMIELGGYLPARKAADNELQERINAFSTKDIYRITEPLIFMRILPDSLSRADFRPGWQHPARRAFWSSYRTWHAQASTEDLMCAAYSTAPVYVPPRFTSPPSDRAHLDVVLAADWCEFGETQASALEEITLLLASGYSVGILHLENTMHLSEYARSYIAPVQELVSNGDVSLVLADETFYDVDLLVVRSPELLQYMPREGVAFRVGRLAVLASEGPMVSVPFQVRYVPEDCAGHARTFFGIRPTWVPGSPEVRVELRSFLPGSEISELNSEQVFHPRQWRVSRKRVRSGTPVLGRWSGSTPSDWPSVLADIQRLWPMGGDADVRLFGRPTRALEALGTKHLPASWIAFNEREISRRTFYRSLDFFVHFTGRSQSPKLELPVLEALAAGCVVVLPEPAEKLYGDAALYAAPEDVSELVEGYHSDPSRFLEQSRRGVEFAETLGVGAQAQYTQLVSRLLQSTSSDEQERVSL